VNHIKLTGAFLMVCAAVSAQGPQDQPVYRVTVTSRTAKAISYQHRSGATKINFVGTDLLPGSRGEAKVESQQGRIEIEVEFDGLQPATRNGAEYLTYVLWAITPEGRTANLGEVILNGTKSKLDVTTELQVFGLVVTAEPYYAVSQPSDLIVMENVVRADTAGKVELIDAKYELLQRGQYRRLSNPLALHLDKKLPLELYEGRNAVQIARSVGADKYAPETFQKAEKSLAQAEAYQARNAGRKPVAMTAREAVQMAEDSRAIAVKRQDEEALNAARLRSSEREANAENGRIAAQSETDRVKRDAETARLKAQGDTERLTREKNAQAAASQADAERVKRENDARMAAAAIDADRLKTQNEARETAAAAEADRLKRENDQQRASTQTELENAAKARLQLETEKSELRVHLLAQFNAILQTRDTPRGLIVNMSDVLFDTGKYSLRPAAREKLAKLAGIVSGHPGLMLAVEGYTDSVGGDEYNQQLSEHRSEGVRDYLTQQGMASGSVSAKGFGKTQPVATNDTAEGRQQNRRVELVISGEVIGTVIGTPLAIR
jgi:outer membrane protein OmpA-like peptidoglycan-associated protein